MKHHYSEAKRLVAADLDETDSEQVLLRYVLGADLPEYHEFHNRRIHAEASLLAMLQCVHATADNLGHVIYYGLNFDADPKHRMEPHRISMHKVSASLRNGALKNAVDEYVDAPHLRHVAALVNHSKHRSVVTAPISVSFVEDVESHGLKFEGFHYKEDWYPQRWAMRFVSEAFNTVQAHVLGVGGLLNKELGA